MEKSLDYSLENPNPSLKTQSLVAGITNEWKPNSYINKSVCGETWHDFYLQDSSEGSLDSNDCKCQAFSKTAKCLFELRYTNLLEKYYKETSSLKQRISELMNETELAYQELSRLKTQNANIQQDYTLQIHNIQVRHQQKMLRTKNDIEALVRSIETKLEAQFKNKHEQVVIELKNKHEAELEVLRIEYEEKVEAVRNDHEFEIIKLQEEAAEEEIMKINQKVSEIVEAQIQDRLQKVEEKYQEMLQRARKEKAKAKESKPEEMVMVEYPPEISEMPKKLREYEKSIKDLQEIIKSQENTIQEITSSLSSGLKRRPKKVCELDVTSSFSILQKH